MSPRPAPAHAPRTSQGGRKKPKAIFFLPAGPALRPCDTAAPPILQPAAGKVGQRAEPRTAGESRNPFEEQSELSRTSRGGAAEPPASP